MTAAAPFCRALLGAALALSGVAAQADERGFSYFMGLGRQSVTHQETPSLFAAKSRASADSLLVSTGALYAIDADRLLALDAETTFAPRATTERWTATASTLAGANVSDPLLQTNRFSLHQSNTRVLGQQRLRGAWFATAGASFHSHSFKRYAFAAGPDKLVTLPAGTVEESASEVLLHAGLALESEQVRGTPHHYSVRLLLGRPAWRRVDNTAFADRRFSGTGGYDLSLAGRYSLALHPSFHIGLWAQWVYSQRQRQVQQTVELPRTELRTLGTGVELLWKL